MVFYNYYVRTYAFNLFAFSFITDQLFTFFFATNLKARKICTDVDSTVKNKTI